MLRHMAPGEFMACSCSPVDSEDGETWVAESRGLLGGAWQANYLLKVSNEVVWLLDLVPVFLGLFL